MYEQNAENITKLNACHQNDFLLTSVTWRQWRQVRQRQTHDIMTGKIATIQI